MKPNLTKIWGMHQRPMQGVLLVKINGGRKSRATFPFNTSQTILIGITKFNSSVLLSNEPALVLYIGIGLSVKTVVLHGGGVSVTWPRIMSARWK